MGLIWRLATPTSEDKEKEDNITYKWEDYALKLFEIVISRHKKTKRIICVNDTYKSAQSIKDSERLLRKSNKPVKNEFIKSCKPFPSIHEFNNLLSKPENKIRLQVF